MIKSYDEQRDLAIFDDVAEFACKYFLDLAKTSINNHGSFSVALSGGSTPKILYNKLKNFNNAIDWNKVYIFFSDERSVPPTDPDSNYKMAMENGFSDLPIPKENIFRMEAEKNIEDNAKNYERIIKQYVKNESFDLILLGMGDDGHTASLFPNTEALKELSALVVKNHVPQKQTDRMTFTYPLIKNAKHILFLTTGKQKAAMLANVLKDKSGIYPAGKIASSHNKVLWAIDPPAASCIS